MAIKVAVNGYGTIGKRIAHAISRLRDFELVGVAKYTPDYEALVALSEGLKLYIPKDRAEGFRKLGIEPEGEIEYLIEEAELIYDASPGGKGIANKKMYEERGKPAVFQGGEDPEVADISYSTLCNFEEAIGRKYVRVVSCNTTGLLRLLCSLKELGIEKVFATIIRRGSDPKEDKRGPINAIKLDPPAIPSHHAEDARTVAPWLNIDTVALAVPTTLMHMHVIEVEFSNEVGTGLLKKLENVSRILAVPGAAGMDSTSQVIEFARDMGRRRYDIYENVLFASTLTTRGRRAYVAQAVHQEAIVIPENIDVAYAIMNEVTDRDKVIEKVNAALGIGALSKPFKGILHNNYMG